jgi:hypothetical protein
LRRQSAARNAVYFLIICGTAAVTDTTIITLSKTAADQQAAAEKAQFKTAVDEIQSVGSALMDASSTPSEIDQNVKSSGDAGAIEKVVKGFAANLLSDRQAYLQEVKATGFPGFLKPASLAADPSMRRGRAKLAENRRIIARYKALSRSRMSQFRAAITTSRLSDPLKRPMLAGADNSIAKVTAQTDREWDSEDSIMVEYDDALAVLARGRWEIVGGRIAFTDAADMSAFNAHVRAAKRLAAEQKTMREQDRRTFQDGLQKVQQDVR